MIAILKPVTGNAALIITVVSKLVKSGKKFKILGNDPTLTGMITLFKRGLCKRGEITKSG